MKPANWQAKNEQEAKLKLEMNDLKMTLNREIKQVIAKRNEWNSYQEQFDNSGTFKTLNKQENLHDNSELANILNPVVDKFKQKYNIEDCETFVGNLDDEFTSL